jgi:hypothetical protein
MFTSVITAKIFGASSLPLSTSGTGTQIVAPMSADLSFLSDYIFILTA